MPKSAPVGDSTKGTTIRQMEISRDPVWFTPAAPPPQMSSFDRSAMTALIGLARRARGVDGIRNVEMYLEEGTLLAPGGTRTHMFITLRADRTWMPSWLPKYDTPDPLALWVYANGHPYSDDPVNHGVLITFPYVLSSQKLAELGGPMQALAKNPREGWVGDAELSMIGTGRATGNDIDGMREALLAEFRHHHFIGSRYVPEEHNDIDAVGDAVKRIYEGAGEAPPVKETDATAESTIR